MGTMHGAKLELITLRCVNCGRWVALRVDPGDLDRHLRHGVFVQDAFIDRDGTPYLSPSERELFPEYKRKERRAKKPKGA
jgi:hypothetical protein